MNIIFAIFALLLPGFACAEEAQSAAIASLNLTEHIIGYLSIVVIAV